MKLSRNSTIFIQENSFGYIVCQNGVYFVKVKMSVSTETIVGEYQVMKAPLLSLQLYFICTVG